MDHLQHRNCHPAGSYSSCTDSPLPQAYHPHHNHHHHHHHPHHHSQHHSSNNSSTTNTSSDQQLSHQQQQQHHHHHLQQQHHQHPTSASSVSSSSSTMRSLVHLDTSSLQQATNQLDMLPITTSAPENAAYQQHQYQQQQAAYHQDTPAAYQQQQPHHQSYQQHQLLDPHTVSQLNQPNSRQATYHHSVAAVAAAAAYLPAASVEASYDAGTSPHNLTSAQALPMRNQQMYLKSSPNNSHSPQHQHQYTHLAGQHAAYNAAAAASHLNPHNLHHHHHHHHQQQQQHTHHHQQQQLHHHPTQYLAAAAQYPSPHPPQAIYSPASLGLLASDQGTNLTSKQQPNTATTSATSTPASSINHDRLSSDSLKHADCLNQPSQLLPDQSQLLQPHPTTVLAYTPTTEHLSVQAVQVDHNLNNNSANNKQQISICLDRLSADSLKQEAAVLNLDPQHRLLEDNSLSTKSTYSPKQSTKQHLQQQINEQLATHNQLNLTTTSNNNNNKLLDNKPESQLSQLHQHCAVLLDEQQHGSVMQAAAMNSPNNGTNASNSTQNSNNNNSTNNGNSSGRSKRLRTSFKHNQLKEMKRWFSRNQNPDAKDLKTLAQTTGLSKRVLQVWFQNARAKYRRNNAKVAAVSQQLFDVNQHTPHLLQFQQQQHHQHHQPPTQPQQQQQQHQQQNYYQHHSSRSLTVELEHHHQASSLTNPGAGQQGNASVVVGSSVGPPPPPPPPLA